VNFKLSTSLVSRVSNNGARFRLRMTNTNGLCMSIFLSMLVQYKHKVVMKMVKQQLSDSGLDSPVTVWTDLPEYVFEAVVEHLQGDREVSAVFRRVCHAWREAHDRLVTVLKPKDSPQGTRVWKKFGSVKTLHLNASLVNDDILRALSQLFSLISLSLGLRKSRYVRSALRDRRGGEDAGSAYHSHLLGSKLL
jgi:hypothetical protein